MSRVCQITGKRFQVGNHVSHSNHRTKRKFHPNLITKRFFIPEDGKWITLKLSAAGLRTINKIGVSAALKRAKLDGFYNG